MCRLINSEASDQFFVSHAQRSYYEELMRAGVKVYWYRAPVLLHSKCIAIDEDIAVIGSSNLDMRSFHLNMEVTLLVYDRETVAQLRQIEAAYLSRAKLLTLEEWRKRSTPASPGGECLPPHLRVAIEMTSSPWPCADYRAGSITTHESFVPC